MAYRISVDEQAGVVEIVLAGDSAHGEHLKARAELLETCLACNTFKVLVDARALAGARPTTRELFDFGASWAELAKARPVYLAGALPRDPATREWWKFGEVVAAERGFITRAFDDPAQARAWLLEL